MPTLAEIRQQYPQYDNLSDDELADGLHRKFYSDLPKDEFLAKIGAAPPQAAPPEQPAFSGAIMPFSRSQSGETSFDSNAGLLGAAKRAFSLPGDVYQGKVDPRSDEAIERSADLGMIASPVGPGVRAAPGMMRATRPAEVKAPTSEALNTTASQGYKQAREMGVDFSSKSVADMAAGMRRELEQDGILAELAPKTYSILEKLASPPEGSIAQLSGLHAARRALKNAASDFSNPTEKLAAKRLVASLDRFIEKPDPASVVAGPAAAAGDLMRDSRGNYAAAKRSDQLTGVEEAADLRAAAANSGRNLDNTIRQRVASVLLDPKKISGFSKEEIARLQDVTRGGVARNATRRVGNFFGGGGGLGGALTGTIGATLGGTVGGIPGGIAGGLVLPAIGSAAKTAGNAMTKRALHAADEMVRKRSPLFDEMMKAAPLQAISPERRAAIIRSILAATEAQPATSAAHTYGPGGNTL